MKSIIKTALIISLALVFSPNVFATDLIEDNSFDDGTLGNWYPIGADNVIPCGKLAGLNGNMMGQSIPLSQNHWDVVYDSERGSYVATTDWNTQMIYCVDAERTGADIGVLQVDLKSASEASNPFGLIVYYEDGSTTRLFTWYNAGGTWDTYEFDVALLEQDKVITHVMVSGHSSGCTEPCEPNRIFIDNVMFQNPHDEECVPVSEIPMCEVCEDPGYTEAECLDMCSAVEPEVVIEYVTEECPEQECPEVVIPECFASTEEDALSYCPELSCYAETEEDALLSCPVVEVQEPISIVGGDFLIADPSANLVVTSLGKDAGHVHELYAVVNDVEYYLFDSADEGRSVAVGTFPTGTVVKFLLKDLTSGYDYWTGNGSLNPDGIEHVELHSTDSAYIWEFGFEDLYDGGDLDFDDCMFSVENVMGIPSVQPVVISDTADETLEGNLKRIKITGNTRKDISTLTLTLNKLEGVPELEAGNAEVRVLVTINGRTAEFSGTADVRQVTGKSHQLKLMDDASASKAEAKAEQRRQKRAAKKNRR